MRVSVLISVAAAIVGISTTVSAQICGGIWCDEGKNFPGTWYTTNHQFSTVTVGSDNAYNTPAGMVSWMEWRSSTDPFIGDPQGRDLHFFVRGEFKEGTTAPPRIQMPVIRDSNGNVIRVFPSPVVYPDNPQFPGPPEAPVFRIKPKIDGGGVRGKLEDDIGTGSKVKLIEASPALFFEEVTLPNDVGLTFLILQNRTRASEGDWLHFFFQETLITSLALGGLAPNELLFLPIDFSPFSNRTGYFSALLDSDYVVGASVQFVPNFYQIDNVAGLNQIASEFTVTPVPEPGPALLFLLGLALLWTVRGALRNRSVGGCDPVSLCPAASS
jgi:hypothetical protein